MTYSKFVKRAATAGVCVGVGAVAGIAGSAAAPTRPSKSPRSAAVRYVGGRAAGTALPVAPGIVMLAAGSVQQPVHGVEVVPNKGGDGFDTVTDDSGTVKSVSGDTLTIVEGTDKATYATPAVTIPAGATVQRNFQPAKLADIQPGDHVDVRSDSDGTTNVMAMDAAHWPPKPPSLAGCGKPGSLPLPMPLTLQVPVGPTGSAGVASGSTTAAGGTTGSTGTGAGAGGGSAGSTATVTVSATGSGPVTVPAPAIAIATRPVPAGAVGGASGAVVSVAGSSRPGMTVVCSVKVP